MEKEIDAHLSPKITNGLPYGRPIIIPSEKNSLMVPGYSKQSQTFDLINLKATLTVDNSGFGEVEWSYLGPSWQHQGNKFSYNEHSVLHIVKKNGSQ